MGPQAMLLKGDPLAGLRVLQDWLCLAWVIKDSGVVNLGAETERLQIARTDDLHDPHRAST